MTERRTNWKADVSKAAMQRAKRRQDIIVEIDRIRKDLQTVDVKSNQYDKLVAERAELRAKLATI